MFCSSIYLVYSIVVVVVVAVIDVVVVRLLVLPCCGCDRYSYWCSEYLAL